MRGVTEDDVSDGGVNTRAVKENRRDARPRAVAWPLVGLNTRESRKLVV